MKAYKVEHLFEKENIDLKTECLCQYVSGENRKVRIHNHEFYEVFLTLSHISHFINGKTERLERGSLVFIKPSDIHGVLYNKNCDSHIINFSFSSHLLGLMTEYLAVSRTFVDNLQPCRIMLTEFETQKLIEKMNKIITGVKSDPIYIRCLLFELFTMFLSETKQEEKVFPKWFENMCAQMKERENFSMGISRMTEISGKSREYISRSVKKYLGLTPTDFINDLRLTYAASKIINTDENITDICIDTGFYSISWFNKMFIKKYGISPNKFRKKEKNYESADI